LREEEGGKEEEEEEEECEAEFCFAALNFEAIIQA
jgi:hypothetical protein